MARAVTLFTGQWADLPLEELAPKAKEFGYDGLELACWGDHFEVDKALEDDNYCQSRWDILEKNGLSCGAISNHLVGQAMCDNIDARHEAILTPRIWGDGNPSGVQQRAIGAAQAGCRIVTRLHFGHPKTRRDAAIGEHPLWLLGDIHPERLGAASCGGVIAIRTKQDEFLATIPGDEVTCSSVSPQQRAKAS